MAELAQQTAELVSMTVAYKTVYAQLAAAEDAFQQDREQMIIQHLDDLQSLHDSTEDSHQAQLTQLTDQSAAALLQKAQEYDCLQQEVQGLKASLSEIHAHLGNRRAEQEAVEADLSALNVQEQASSISIAQYKQALADMTAERDASQDAVQACERELKAQAQTADWYRAELAQARAYTIALETERDDAIATHALNTANFNSECMELRHVLACTAAASEEVTRHRDGLQELVASFQLPQYVMVSLVTATPCTVAYGLLWSFQTMLDIQHTEYDVQHLVSAVTLYIVLLQVPFCLEMLDTK